MGKRSNGTRTVTAFSAAANRRKSNRTAQKALSGNVRTSDEALKVMESYKNLYKMSPKEQKAFTDTFAQAIMDTYSKKHDRYEKEYLKKTNEAFAKNDKSIYDMATSIYNTKMRLLSEERVVLTDMYNKFIKVKK